MTARKRRYLLWSGGIAICLFLSCSFVSCVWHGLWAEDFSKWSPDRVFQMVTGKHLPKGVTQVRTSGRHYFIKRWAWLRIQGDAAAIASIESIAQGGDQLTWPEMQQQIPRWGSANSFYDKTDHQKVGWDDLKRIAHPVCYFRFLGNNDPWLWQCCFIFDHANHTVYMQVNGG